MTVKPLYRYTRPDGGVTVSPVKPKVEYTEKFRIEADEGKILTHPDHGTASCIDVDSTDGWTEINDEESIELTVVDCLDEMSRLGVEV